MNQNEIDTALAALREAVNKRQRSRRTTPHPKLSGRDGGRYDHATYLDLTLSGDPFLDGYRDIEPGVL